MAAIKELYFCTGNRHKFNEVAEFFNGKLKVIQADIDVDEPRGESFEEIAKSCAKQAYKKLKKPVFVEDAGLAIPSLGGFPGTYSAWVFKKLGNDGILKLLEGKTGARLAAEFVSCIGFCDGKAIKTFNGICKGIIAPNCRGNAGFGYDPIFQPAGHNETFAELGSGKLAISHRSIAVGALQKYLRDY
ncbi:non-canonical purine NTP pyrophosphatase, RdgB/HAM1 family [Candidatus Micrarchaeota archaeon CG08_land_8_20_14_0_20_49_17]|nr:MAG: non-canonical purine NTP pyrophosphatase, RdgB/HAM1 family [Candidatus Micrarchaeota archaeon CG1_02_49_24]PIU09972.1 MAG: non-canonical purine NTP pyrophosphatase, RdgB/HAM1 family [Candidatus Micrarchaeota archaeon CG08_land_8_20_14_0_20_49_17]PIU81426.1 MAG: non-canonical purine NTP pyrophosphatase, RdgB/HAM1 family [Candidatus Micrarchaeota archaeon CG06_land_8_20_14_3_00_50_6]PIZ96224.1 MAG: non-canonical purine NTP pyrophosphatase, RdgB/HAM1 family [Candidatus Micrarchaeota archaeo